MKGKNFFTVIGLAVAGLLGMTSSASALLIDNGIAGDGFWQVNALNAGESRTGNLDPTGAEGQTDVIFDYFHYVQVGGGNGVRLSNTNVTSAAAYTGANQVSSAGDFAGQNATIFWDTRSWISPGSPLYITELIFRSDSPFGNVNLIQYLDEDVLGVSDDRLIVLGTPGGDDFQLLTIDDDNNVGVSHAATYNTAVGMGYAGWAARPFSQLRSAILNGTATYSIAGNVTNIPFLGVGGDARFPASPAYGTLDITSALSFTFDPTASYASVLFSLGGSPDGTPTPPPEADPIPEPATMLLLGTGLVGVAGTARRRKKNQV